MKRIVMTILIAVCTLSTAMAQAKVIEDPQTDATYRIPLQKGAVVMTERVSPLVCGLATQFNLVDFCAWKFTTNQPSEVYASRKGVVVEATDNSVLILHEDGLYSEYMGLGNVKVAQGESVKAGARLGAAKARHADIEGEGKWSVVMMVYHVRSNPDYGQVVLNGAYKHLRQYINPIFTTRGKCKTHLTEGNAYTVRTRTWCWPWE